MFYEEKQLKFKRLAPLLYITIYNLPVQINDNGTSDLLLSL